MLFIIHYRGKAHTDTDIMIAIENERTIFLGDIVMPGRISSQPQDADIRGQIRALQFILHSTNEVDIPGHGRGGGKEVPQEALAFLTALYASVRKHYEEGLS